MKSDLYAAINQIAAERNIPREAILRGIEDAIITAYRRISGTDQNVAVKLDLQSGDARVFERRTIVEEVTEPALEVSLQEVLEVEPNAKVGDMIEKETTPANFGRIAAQTAKQVVMQRIREAERDRVFSEFNDREGDIVLANVQRQDNNGNWILEVGRAEAILPPNHQVKTERYRSGNRMRVLLLEVQKNPKGPQLIVSRADRSFLKRLFELEVPEIHSGIVEIKSIARESGMRSKVAVSARQSNVDPVGSCVGMKGQRIQKIVDELGGEKIDVVLWDPDMSVYIANALSPAQVLTVDLNEDEKTATVVVPERMLSLAIGKEGQNARLAAKLTGWRIDIKSAAIPEEDQEEYVPSEEEVARRAAAAMRAEHAASANGSGDGFQPPVVSENGAAPKEERRKVRPNNTVVYQNVAYGPLPEAMPGETIRLRDLGDNVEIRTDSGRTIATYPVQAGEPAEEEAEEAEA
ncbi:MAG: transcription termination factor NusA [Chloroflexota bacterium]|nr:transcription termination factor NusA [Chloroflexota bacterium]MDQ5865393.1 transcription termination factor NusA [Chloroflexota bacterium]